MNEERDGHLGEVIDRRVQVYGDPIAGFAEIATMWSVLFDVEVPAWKVPIAQALMKVVRMKTSPDYSDHSDDIDGYLDIFRKIIGPDMIQARTVNEYIEKKWPAEQQVLVDKNECLHWNKHLQVSDHTEGECPVNQPIPYQVVDGFDCITAGEHLNTQRHTRDECPVVQL